jgi:hypothetical protein
MDEETRNAFGEVRQEFATVRREMATEFAAVRGEMTGAFTAVRQEMAEIRQHTDDKLAQVVVELRQSIKDSHADTLYRMGVMMDSLRSDIRLIAEGFGINSERIAAVDAK